MSLTQTSVDAQLLLNFDSGDFTAHHSGEVDQGHGGFFCIFRPHLTQCKRSCPHCIDPVGLEGIVCFSGARSKDSIVGYWEILRNLKDVKFNKEAETLLILPATDWQNSLFSQMSAAIEMTALQRSVGRWPHSLQNVLA